MRAFLSVTVLVAASSCGGAVVTYDPDGGGGQGGQGGTSGTGAAGAAAGGSDPCLSSVGFRACLGTTGCPDDPEACQGCINDWHEPGSVGVCWEGPHEARQCVHARDDICLHAHSLDTAFPWEFGELLADLGEADAVRHADFGRWNGEPIPSPSSCPAVAGLQVCAPQCAPCPEDQYCRGRAPRHPFGICLPEPNHPTGKACNTGAGGCAADHACLVYEADTDDEEAQELVKTHGVCLPTAACLALAEADLGLGLGYECYQKQ